MSHEMVSLRYDPSESSYYNKDEQNLGTEVDT